MYKQLMSLFYITAVMLIMTSSSAQTAGPALGTPVSQQQISHLDLIVGSDGSTLPPGNGTAQDGEVVYRSKCQSCHGAEGEGQGTAAKLVGGSMQSEERPIRTVGSYWPYSSTVFDYIRRAMPANAPKSLTDIEVYQVTAYILFLNGIIERDTVLNQQSLPEITMPNSNGFIDQSDIQ